MDTRDEYGYGRDGQDSYPSIIGFGSRAEAFATVTRFASKWFREHPDESFYGVRFFVRFAGAREWTALSPHTFFRSEMTDGTIWTVDGTDITATTNRNRNRH